MRNGGLIIGNALDSGLRAFSQMQSMDANKQAMGLRDTQAKMQEEQHAASMRNARQQEQINNMRMRQLGQDEQQRAMALFAKRLHAIDAGGDASPEEIEQYTALTGGGRLTDPKYIASEEVGNALAIYPRVLKGEIDKNSPEAIQAYNTLINVQRGATDGRKVTINKVVPSRDGQGVHFGLNVVNADGTVNANGVLTDNRSTDPNDPVSSVSFDELNNAYGAIANLRAVVTNPKIRQALYREYGLGPQQVSAKDQSVIDYNKSRANYYDTKTKNEATNGAGGGGKLPAQAQLHEFLKTEFPNASPEDLWTLANSSPENPWDFINRHIAMQTAAEKDSDSRTSPEEKEDAAIAAYQRIRPKLRPDLNPKPKPKSTEKQAPELLAKPGATSTASDPQEQKYYPRPSARAIEFLRKNPSTKDSFLATYGYLPQ